MLTPEDIKRIQEEADGMPAWWNAVEFALIGVATVAAAGIVVVQTGRWCGWWQ